LQKRVCHPSRSHISLKFSLLPPGLNGLSGSRSPEAGARFLLVAPIEKMASSLTLEGLHSSVR